MGDILVVFGSESDNHVFGPVMEKLRAAGMDAELEVCSAHRAPEKLAKILKESNAKIVIAGAGLSAALPGFIASHSEKLVIGIPVKGNYAGLDALLSIHQMPKGFSVLGTGTQAVDEAVKGAKKALAKKKKITLIRPEGEEALKRFEACEKKLEELGAAFKTIEEKDYAGEDTVYIDFVELETATQVDDRGKLVIFVPVKKNSDEKDALKLLELTKKGLWVGLGRGENAAISAAKIIKEE